MYVPHLHDVAVTATVFTAPVLKRALALSAFADEAESLGYTGGDTIKRWSSLIGIITAICGNIIISFALNIQRYAHIRLHRELEEKKRQSRNISRNVSAIYGTAGGAGVRQDGNDEPESPLGHSFASSDFHDNSKDEQPERETYLRSPYWWGGIILMTIGETGNFLAYGFAPASIVSPLGVVALISNCVIAPIMLKERFRMRDFWGVVVAVGGAVTVVLSAKQEEKRLGPHEVIGAITTMEFEIYMATTAVIIGTLIWASPRYGSKTILIDLGLVGLFGGYTALSTKGVASMLSSSVWRAFATPITYVLIAVLIGTAIMQVKYVNKALQRFDSTQVIPVQFVMFTLSVIIGSAVLYRDFESTTPERAAKFVGGCLLTFFGVFLITSGRASHSDAHSDTASEDEGRISMHENGGEYYQDSVNKHAPIHRTPLHQELQASGETTDEDDDLFGQEVSRRTSRVSGAESAQGRHRTPQAPSFRFTPANSDFNPTERTPLVENAIDSTPTSAFPSYSHSPNLEHARAPLSRHGSRDGLRPNQHHQSEPALLRPVTPARHSMTKSMIPGPFISPLSSSLSVVVAESLRRGTDIYGSRRRPKLRLSRTRSGDLGWDSDEEGTTRIRSRPGTRSRSPTKRSTMGRLNDVRDALSQSLERGPTLGGRRRAFSLGQKLSDFFSARRDTRPHDGESAQEGEVQRPTEN